jgi:hypothetical protein
MLTNDKTNTYRWGFCICPYDNWSIVIIFGFLSINCTRVSRAHSKDTLLLQSSSHTHFYYKLHHIIYVKILQDTDDKVGITIKFSEIDEN